MGTKYSSNTVSGYNSSPPADDGSVTEANKVKWSTVKTKLSDPVNTLAATINTELVTQFDNGPTALTSNTTLGATHYNQVIEASGASFTLTLTDAGTLTAGWFTELRVTGTNNITLTGATTADTCNGVAFSDKTYTLRPGFSAKIIVNAAADGFLVAYESINRGNDGQIMSVSPGGEALQPWAINGHYSGLALSLAADTEHDITVATGTCANSDNSYILKSPSALTKQIDNTWSVGTNAGGLFSGSVANTTQYYFFLIHKDDDGTLDAGFDTSSSAANIPTGYTVYRQLGYVITDGSANIDLLAYNIDANTITGQWKPTLQDASLSDAESQTYSTQNGNFTKIGKQVIFQGRILLTSLGSLTGGDSAVIANLPYTSIAGSDRGCVNFGLGAGLAITANSSVGGDIGGGVTYISLNVWDSTAGSTPMTVTEVSDNGELIFEGSYFTA